MDRFTKSLVALSLLVAQLMAFIGAVENSRDLRSKPAHEFYSRDFSTPKKSWMVLTTIFHPTDCIVTLASFPGWEIVVVADKKTPVPWWNNSTESKIPKNLHYIPYAYQSHLKYQIRDLLPDANYGKKNLGFLYAIEHGAEIIYETDDDNCATDVKHIVRLEEKGDDAVLLVESESLTENAYAYYGFPSMWQRGIPVDDIMLNRKDQPHPLKKAEKMIFYSIQQGLADHDPDVDAVFRSTRDLPIYFDKSKAPIALPRGTFSPTNSQNTLVYSSAFWSCLLPVTVSPRVTDIWRGLWAQRLLWDLEQDTRLTFLPPTVQTIRTPQSYLANWKAETQLYEQSGSFIRFLRAWRSCKPTLFDRLRDLGRALVVKRFWGQQDADLVEAWISDLMYLNYSPPAVRQCTEQEHVSALYYESLGRLGHINISSVQLDSAQADQTKADPALLSAIRMGPAFVRPTYFTLNYSDYRGF